MLPLLRNHQGKDRGYLNSVPKPHTDSSEPSGIFHCTRLLNTPLYKHYLGKNPKPGLKNKVIMPGNQKAVCMPRLPSAGNDQKIKFTSSWLNVPGRNSVSASHAQNGQEESFKWLGAETPLLLFLQIKTNMQQVRLNIPSGTDFPQAGTAKSLNK